MAHARHTHDTTHTHTHTHGTRTHTHAHGYRTDPVLAARMQEFLESHLTFHPLEKAFHQLLQQFTAALKPTDPLRRVVINPRIHSAVATATTTASAVASTSSAASAEGK